ncbi:MAG: 50S ribosomal protein L18 [Nanoarchaeota archaeon]
MFKQRIRRHKKIRRKIIGTEVRPRLSVFRSSKHIFAQIIDDSKSQTLAWASDDKEKGTKMERSYKVGLKIAENASKKKIKDVVFDRGGFLYQGRVEQLAKGARKGGLKF